MPWYGFTSYGTPDIPEIVSSVPSGQIFMYIASDVPDGFLRCDGSQVLITDYQDLYDAFVSAGVSFGAAALGFFRLPDFRNRFPIGHNLLDTALDADPSIDLSTIGNTGGSTTHSHTGSSPAHTHNTPTHTHSGGDHDHTLGNHTHDIPDHTHGVGSIQPTNTDTGYSNVRNAAATTLRNVAPRHHTHNVTGPVGSSGTPASTGPRNGANSPINTTTGTPSASTTTATIDTALGLPTAGYTAPSIGNDSIPPYYSVHFLIKT